ncbi:hypothetical protein [Flavobacterium ginsenosidimutans]|uniref:Bacteriocin n=1 Tax=Flavobacterium ginsenosidimutans TaxID=687844 RepID=A0ABZ2QCM0_9FLAO|nr:hypothetical protein [Flavobacterium ginsenosidimutans]KAF2332386.1 hypothetical protein DM444_10520 [Flavobacterium ginsenosidimutans]
MENITELTIEEAREISGGVTFAYRVGEFIRFSGHAYLSGISNAYDMVYSW